MQTAVKQASAPTLKRELGLRDLTLFAITTIISTRWIPAAAHAGSGSIVLWFAAAIFFVVPLSFAVAALTKKYPGTGGLYLWARNDFGPWHGFLCFWVYWLGMACWFPSAALFYMSVGLSSLGGGNGRFVENRMYLLAAALAAIWIALATNLVGLRVGKWVENAGGACAWILGAILVTVAAMGWMRDGSATPMHLAPHLDWQTVSFWSSIAYAMSGLELAALVGGEIRDPEHNLPRAAWISSTFTTLFYASSTAALLVLLPAGQISELHGLAQAGSRAAAVTGAPWIAPVLGVIVLLSAVGQFGGIGTAVSRLPFAAGMDRLLPSAFAAIHPRWCTPHVSILLLGAVASGLLVLMQVGDTLRAAYQELISLMLIGGFLPYVYIFTSAWKAGQRLSAVSGLAITMVAIACSLVPTSEITNVWLFEAKLAAGTLAMIGSAWILYRRSARQR